MAWLRFMAHLFVAVILGFLYQNIGNEASKVSGNVACLFFFILFLFFSNAMPTVLTCKSPLHLLLLPWSISSIIRSSSACDCRLFSLLPFLIRSSARSFSILSGVLE